MATNKPRITVSLDKETYEILQAYADAMGQTMSGCIGDMVQARKEKMQLIMAKMEQLDKLVNDID